jgi:DNA-binding IclR family transcriptional regulator
MEQKQIQFYLMEKPLSIPLLHILITQHEGLTATQLAHKLHMSVPTLHRLTLEMYNLGLLESKKEGKR